VGGDDRVRVVRILAGGSRRVRRTTLYWRVKLKPNQSRVKSRARRRTGVVEIFRPRIHLPGVVRNGCRGELSQQRVGSPAGKL